MTQKIFILFLVLCGFTGTLKPQKNVAPFKPEIDNNFGYPLEGVKRFTGNYGEIRPNHFHAGIDFATDAVKNIPIHSIGDGYISRIKIATGGYGKVLYVTHANGYVSVYAHQHHFAKNIQDYAKAAQTKQETFEIELFPKPTDLPVKKGEVIGFTGNTGNTTGPHLHFEIREEKTEIPLNPQLFLDFEDTQAPVCHKIGIYKLQQNFKPELIKQINVNGAGKLDEPVNLPFSAGLAFSCFDKEQRGGNSNQVYSISIYIDDTLFYAHKMDGISFDDARYVNCYTDIDPAVKREKYQKCFRTGNNDLPIFVTIKNDGKIHSLSEGKHHKAKIIFADIKKNESSLVFNFIQDSKLKLDYKRAEFKCLLKNEIHKDGIDAVFPEKCFFYDLNFDYAIVKKKSKFYLSDMYKLHSSAVPVFKGFDLSIIPGAYPKGMEEKLCFIQMDDDFTGKSYAGGEFKNGKVSGNVKNLGLYAIDIDTTAPEIKEHAITKKTGNKITGANGIYFTVSDNFSGIGNFRMEINGKWVLAEYEHKKRIIFYLFDDETPKEFTAELKVWDRKKNLAVFRKKYTR